MLWTIIYLLGAYVAYWLVSYVVHRIPASDLSNKTVVITGCDTGFGQLLALKLAHAGMTVFAGCLTDAGLRALQQTAESQPTWKLHVFALDVTNVESVERFYSHVEKALPDKQAGVWALVNNAGVLRGGNLETQPLSAWTLQLNVNVFGIAAMTKTFLPLLRRAKGRIINVASVAGRLGTPGTSSYNASKFAVEGLSDAWRRELAIWGIDVVIIEPGIMKTPLWDQPLKDAEVDSVWGTLTAEQQQLYGREYFAECYVAGKELVDTIGGNPMMVVVRRRATIEHASGSCAHQCTLAHTRTLSVCVSRRMPWPAPFEHDGLQPGWPLATTHRSG